MKYSNEKLVSLACGNSLTGYSINPNSTTSKPIAHVINCLNKKITHASLILLFGVKRISIPIVRSHAIARII
jgi:hypothetical protein